MPSDTQPILLGRYQVLSHISTGGMGSIYKAHDRVSDKVVAIKQVPTTSSTPDLIEHLESEFKLLSKINSPYVVKVFELHHSDIDGHLMSMELVDGETISSFIQNSPGNISYEKGLDVLKKITLGVRDIHLAGVVHRDLKPSNIIITQPDGELKIIDFGISTHTQELMTQTVTKVIGTEAYMSPEQFRGAQLDPRLDIYAIGIIGYELLTGKRPFESDGTINFIFKNALVAPPLIRKLRPDLPLWISVLVKRCLEKEVGMRFNTADEVHQYIQDMSSERIPFLSNLMNWILTR